jgi:hypothetical protein
MAQMSGGQTLAHIVNFLRYSNALTSTLGAGAPMVPGQTMT